MRRGAAVFPRCALKSPIGVASARLQDARGSGRTARACKPNRKDRCMKLSPQTPATLFTIPLGRGFSPGSGGSLMPKLRLHQEPVEETDAIPFPRAVSRIGRWQPKTPWPLVGREHEAET